MNEEDARLLAIVNEGVFLAQEENRRKGIPNVYCINGKIVWQLPDGTVTMHDPNKPVDAKLA